MAGEITNTGQDIVKWLDECMYQLSMKNGSNVGGIESALRNNITLDRVAIALKFQYGSQ